MRTALVRRTVLSASALSLALLATACGGSEKADAKPSASAPAPSPTPEVKALGAAELEKLTLADGDVPKVKLAKAGADDVAKSFEITTDKAQCQPLAEAGGLAPVGKPVTTTERIGTGVPTDPTDPLSITMTSVHLASYDGKGAADALASMKAAGTACTGGFVTTTKGEKTTITSVVPGTVTGGDDAAAWAIVSDTDGETVKSQMVAILKGNNLVVIHALSLTGKSEVPQAYIDAQLKKLG